jgi:hypothetical protein
MPLVDLHAQYGATHGIYVFGYPNITPKEKVALCRKHDLGNWTSFMDDEELAATPLNSLSPKAGICRKNARH